MTKQHKISVFDLDGRMLWFSEGWGSVSDPLVPIDKTACLGYRWLEFLATSADERRARAWLASPEDGAAVILLCRTGIPGDRRLVRAALVKRRVGDYWIAVGDNALTDEPILPGADCSFDGASLLIAATLLSAVAADILAAPPVL